jgi:dihydroxyacid dehydratase/phosphogluconate dehydratase
LNEQEIIPMKDAMEHLQVLYFKEDRLIQRSKERCTPMPRDPQHLRSQHLRTVNHQGDALRLGMNWTEEDLAKPQVLVDSADGMGHPGTFHFRSLIEEVSNGVFEAGGKPGVFTVSDICDGVVQATSGMSYSLISRDIMAAMVEIHALGHPHDGMHIHVGPARIFDVEDEAVEALVQRKVTPGDVVVIRYEGPRANGMPEMYFASTIISSDHTLNTTTALITDGRYSGAYEGSVCRACHARGTGGRSHRPGRRKRPDRDQHTRAAAGGSWSAKPAPPRG